MFNEEVYMGEKMIAYMNLSYFIMVHAYIYNRFSLGFKDMVFVSLDSLGLFL